MSFIQVVNGIPPFEQARLLLSLTISILLLKQVKGTKHAVSLLPLITLFFLYSQQPTQSNNRNPNASRALFPTEQLLTIASPSPYILLAFLIWNLAFGLSTVDKLPRIVAMYWCLIILDFLFSNKVCPRPI